MQPNRIVTIATVVLDLAAAVFAAVADVDWSTRAGVIGGVGLATAAALRWLQGWQKYEADTRLLEAELAKRGVRGNTIP